MSIFFVCNLETDLSVFLVLINVEVVYEKWFARDSVLHFSYPTMTLLCVLHYLASLEQHGGVVVEMHMS